MRENVKVLNLGLMLINVVGSQVLRAAVRTLGEKIQGPAALELPCLTLLQKADFDKAFPLLADLAFTMSRYGTDDERKVAKEAVIQEIEPLRQRQDIDNNTKMTFLGLSLQQRVGDAVLLTALAQIADGIQPGQGRGFASPAQPGQAADPATVPHSDDNVVALSQAVQAAGAATTELPPGPGDQ